MITRDTTKRTVHEPCEKEEVRRGGSRLYRRSGSGRKRFLIGWKKKGGFWILAGGSVKLAGNGGFPRGELGSEGGREKEVEGSRVAGTLKKLRVI